MSAIATAYEHVDLRADGVPIIRGTTIKVVEIVAEKTAYGWSQEEIHLQHPHDVARPYLLGTGLLRRPRGCIGCRLESSA